MRAGTFKKGESGNPSGRPKGARHKTTLAIEALLEGEAEALTRRAVEMALEGDTTAMRLCLERLAPPRRDRPTVFDMPKINTVSDLPKATAALMEAMSTGEITPSEASDFGKVIDAHIRALEVTDIAERLVRLEQGRA